MGQLTNQYVSQSYQGLLNLNNANTGLTANLQTVTDGLGGSSPLQISQTQVNISGTFTVNGQPISVDSGSLVTTSSFNAFTSSMNSFTSSIDGRVDALEIETGSLQNQINQKLNTSSFNSYTSSNDGKVNSLIAATGSYVTETESGSFMITGSVAGNTLTFTKGNGSQFNLTVNTGSLPSGVISGSQQIVDLGFATTSSLNSYTLTSSFNSYTSSNDGKVNDLISKTGSYATTGSNNFVGQQNINGSVNVTGSVNITGTVTATSASFTYVNTVYETASVIYSSGSNQFGDASNDTQTLWGTVNLPSGPLVVTGSVTATNFTGSLQGTASYASNALSSSHAIFADTASFFNGLIASASYAVNADTASIANDLIVRGKCNNNGGLTRGTIVRIVGADGNNPLFDSASWLNDTNSANTLGMLSEDVAFNGFANVVVQGKVIGINTNGMTAGDLLFLSSSGQYTTSSVPAPYHEVRLGQVLRANLNNGSAYITIDNGYELTELHDVDIQAPIVGDVLTYVSGAYGQWVNKDGSELGYATTGSNTFVGQQTILNDVTINSSNPFGTFVNMISTGTTSFNMNSPLTQFQSNGQMIFTNTLATTGSSDISFLTQNGGDIILNTSNSGSVAITGSLNVSGSSRLIGNQTITGSLVVSGSSTIIGNSTISGSLIASGSHTIVGNLVMTGALLISSSAATDILLTGSMVITRPVGSTAASQLILTSSLGNTTLNPGTIRTTQTGLQSFLAGAYFGNTNNTTADEVGMSISPATAGLSGGTGNVIYVNDPTDSYPAMINFQNKATWTDGRISLLRSTDITGSLIASGSSHRFIGALNNTGSLIASGSSHRFIGALNNTGSLTQSGSVNLIGNTNVTGSLIVTGSATITGSVNGNVNNLTVTSNTASLNLNNGNFFVLALTGSQDIRIEPSNIKAGQTINIKLNTTGSGTVSFPTSVKQASGSAYISSTGTTTDIITLISFDNTDLFLANVKNLI